MKKYFFTIVFIINFLYTQAAFQLHLETHQTDTTQPENEKKSIKKIFLPQVYGVIKADFEWNTEAGESRFVVRNARLGVKGDLSPIVNYLMEMDLSDEGKFKVLSAFVDLKPIQKEKHNVFLRLGYQKPLFSTEYLRSPMQIFFARRSLLVDEMTGGIVDVGLVANYAYKNNILPFDIGVGVFNGMGYKNTPFKTPNYSARVRLHPYEGLRFVAQYYGGRNILQNPLNTWSVECAYENESFLIEVAYFNRQVKFIDSNFVEKNEGILVETYYKFPLKNAGFLHYITPTVRWDMLGNQIFQEPIQLAGLTMGINLGIDKRFFKAEVRLNYEKYFKQVISNRQDMFILEMVIGI